MSDILRTTKPNHLVKICYEAAVSAMLPGRRSTEPGFLSFLLVCLSHSLVLGNHELITSTCFPVCVSPIIASSALTPLFDHRCVYHLLCLSLSCLSQLPEQPRVASLVRATCPEFLCFCKDCSSSA